MDAPRATQEPGAPPERLRGRATGHDRADRPRWLFLKILGVVLLAAFASFWVQAHGLVGADGVLPAGPQLARNADYFARNDLWKWAQMPTLGWWGAGDTALHLFSALGCLAAVGLIAGLAPRVMLAAGWVLYLTVFHLGGPFLSFQWDILLLETLLVAIPFAPGGWWPRLATAEGPSRIALWGVRLLLFKLILSSGVVKLTSGDPTWLDGDALSYHHWTQPLPHGLAWFAHNAPGWTHTWGVTATFLVELFLPLLIVFRVRRWRLAVFGGALAMVTFWSEGRLTLDAVPGFAVLALVLDDRVLGRLRPGWIGDQRDVHWAPFLGIVGLMVAITASGSYGFFTLLTVALCLPLLDDQALRRLPGVGPPTAPRPPSVGSRRLALVFAVVLLPLSALQMSRLLGESVPEWISDARAAVFKRVGPFASVNGYGLFATMTRQRMEIVVEGSRDGATAWQPYVFEFKPENLDRVGAFAGLHMPRLDWQMWFAALGQRCRRGWYVGFMGGLLRGAPAVLGLLAHNPFPDGPPLAVRSRRVLYRFTDPAERARTGQVWQARPAGAFCPVLTQADVQEGM